MMDTSMFLNMNKYINLIKVYLKGHKSISIFSSLIPIPLLTTRLATLKHSATVAMEARVQAQEVGVISFTRLSQGDTDRGYLVVR